MSVLDSWTLEKVEDGRALSGFGNSFKLAGLELRQIGGLCSRDVELLTSGAMAKNVDDAKMGRC